MRLRRLDLTRYGHFTDYSLDFGPIKEDKPDLHIIFGPNEAGKTTAFEGYLDLLFGIPKQSPYNFLHDYDNMLVGGALDIDGATVEFTRIKKLKNDLLDMKGEPANPVTLLHVLSGITREQYRAMFSLNDETIEAGGEDILKSQGDLGELLFSAAAGLSDLGLVLDKARADVDAFHKLRAHKTHLGEAKKDIKRLDSEIKNLDTNASTFKILLKSNDDAQLKYDEDKTERDRLLSEKSHIEAVLECLPLLPKLKEINEALPELEGFSDVPAGWINEVSALQKRNEKAKTDKRHASNSILGHNKKRDDLTRDPSILEIKENIELLLDVPKSRAQTAHADVPSRRVDLRILDTDIARSLKQLNFENTTPEQVAEPLLVQMENLATDWAGVEQKLGTARIEQKRAKKYLERLGEDDGASEDVDDVDNEINELLDRIGPEALIITLQNNDQFVQDASDELATAIQGISPWADEVEKLPKPELTEDQATRLVDRWTSLQTDLEKANEEFDEITLKANQLSARIVEAENDESLVSDKEAKGIQSIRDEVWNHHVFSMTPSTAETFHQAMVHCDTVNDARLGTAERLAHLREVQLNIAELEVSRNHLQSKMADIETDIATEREIISAHMKVLRLPKDFDVLDLPKWLNKLSTAHAAANALNIKTKALTKVEQEVSCAAETLKDALSVGSESTLPELTRLARKSVATVAQQSERKVAKRDKIIELSTALQERSDALEELDSSLATFKDEWQKLAPDLPISFSTPAEFTAALPTLREINVWLTKRDELSQRIDAMENDYSIFSNKIKGHAEAIGEEPVADPLVLAELLRTRLTKAGSIETRYNELSNDIEEDDGAEVEAGEELAEISKGVLEKAKHFSFSMSIETIEDLVTAVKKSETARILRMDCSELESRIVTRLGTTCIKTAFDLLSDEDIPGAEAQLESIKLDCSSAEESLTQSIGDLRSASDKLQGIGGDDAVVRLEEERQTIFLTITDQAKQSLRLRLGIMASEKALTRYRDEHRSEMLSDTAKAFQTLTAGRYSDLQTQPDGQKEILLALRKDDKRSISVTDMSKGTRFQLYLALRLAGYHQFSSGGTTLPFVADDIMETFDNTRTSAALELLQQMALSGQALYFTHHEHVVDLAREKCGDSVTIHNLMTG